jgi:phospholipid/cholesterol/gamma-HCH transport system substrate-binding protein
MSTAVQPHVRRKSLAGPLTKSVIFIAVTALATTILALSIASTGPNGTVSYNALFTDVTGLTVGSDVDIAGVRIGQVNQIAVADRNLARVSFAVQAGRRLPASVTATIKYLNLVGQRYIDLQQGAGPPDQVLGPGATIPVSRTTPALNLTDLFNGFQPLFQALSPNDVNKLSGEIIQVLQGQGGTVAGLVAHIGSLTTTLAAKDKVINSVIGNLNAVLKTVNSRGSELSDLVTTLRQLVSGLAADRQPIGTAIGAIARLTTATAGLLQLGRAPLKQDIIGLGRLSRNLAGASPLVSTFLNRLPVKMTDIARLASYGSWLNFYMCEATLTGARSSFGAPPPTGVQITAARCRG